MSAVFPLNIEIVKEQIQRWVKRYGIAISKAVLCRVTLQHEFLSFVDLRYCVVLVMEDPPDEFLSILKRIDGLSILLENSFSSAYMQNPEQNWRQQWHIEVVTDVSELSKSNVIQINDESVLLLENKNQSKSQDKIDNRIKTAFDNAISLWDEAQRIRKSKPDIISKTMRVYLTDFLDGLHGKLRPGCLTELVIKAALHKESRSREKFATAIMQQHIKENNIQFAGNMRGLYRRLNEK